MFITSGFRRLTSSVICYCFVLGGCSPTQESVSTQSSSISAKNEVKAHGKHSASFADTDNYILMGPRKGKGPQALLVLLPGADLGAEKYLHLAAAIQKRAHMALWIGLPKLAGPVPNVQDASAKVSLVLAAAQEAGFQAQPGKNIFIGGHSAGGTLAQGLAAQSDFAGLVLLGSYLARIPGNPDLMSFSKPVLTLSGELDGQTWITRIALDVQAQQSIASTIGELPAAATKPVIILPRINHMQFAAGDASPKDIPAVLPLAVAHHKIAKVVTAFIWAQLSQGGRGSFAPNQLLEAVMETREMVAPFLAARAQEQQTWCSQTQIEMTMLDEANKALLAPITTAYTDFNAFTLSKPTFALGSDGKWQIFNHAYTTFITDPNMDSMSPEGALDITCKMKSKEAVHAMLGLPQPSNENLDNTCAQLNEWTMNWALGQVSDRVKERYLAQGKKLHFVTDNITLLPQDWLPFRLQFVQDATDPMLINVQSGRIYTPVNFVPARMAGMYYCKLLSPARAVEWIMLESLK